MNDLFESSDALYLKEIFTDPVELEQVEIDLANIADSVDHWLDGNEKLDPDICRYMGMLLLFLANKLESNQS